MSYRLGGEGLRTVELEGELSKRYDDTYAITLTDQNVTGQLHAIEDGVVTVTDWRLTTPNADYLTTESGKRLLLIDGMRAQPELESGWPRHCRRSAHGGVGEGQGGARHRQRHP